MTSGSGGGQGGASERAGVTLRFTCAAVLGTVSPAETQHIAFASSYSPSVVLEHSLLKTNQTNSLSSGACFLFQEMCYLVLHDVGRALFLGVAFF